MEFKRQLQATRRQDANSNNGNVKEMTAAATPIGLIGIISQASLASDWMYGLALLAAMLKDFLDLIQFIIIFYGIVTIFSFCTSIFILFMMLLGNISDGGSGANKKGKQTANMFKRGLVLLGGTTAEMLFGINFLPWETITVLIIYAMVLSAKKQKKEAEKNKSSVIPKKAAADGYNRKIPRQAAADDYYNEAQEAA